MPAAYVTEKVQKFITPDGVEHIRQCMHNDRFAVAYLFDGYPDWFMKAYFNKKSNAEKIIPQLLRNPAIAKAIVIERADFNYVLTGTKRLRGD